MRKLISLLLLSVVTLSSFSPTAEVFPTITCTNLKNKQVVLPTAYQGQRTVVALMLSAKADKQMQKWAQPLYNSLVADGMGGMMGGNMYQAKLCFVGVVKGLAKVALPELLKKAKQEVDAKYHEQFMYTDTELSPLIQRLGITNKEVPYFITLEKDGTILHIESGEYSDDKLNEITGSLLN